MKNKKIKKILLNISILLISIIIFLIILEIVLRLIAPNPNVANIVEFIQYSQLYGWEIKPNLNKTLIISDGTAIVETNSQGFRDYEHKARKNRDKYRIVIVGDSFTWGHGVDNNETYSKILETYDKKIETINMAVGGYGTDQEYLTIMNKGLKYNPDMIILMYTVSTDVADVNTDFMHWPKPQFKIINDTLVLTNVPVPGYYALNTKEASPGFIKSLALYPFVRDNLLSLPLIREFLIDNFHLGRYYDFKENYDVVFKIFLELNKELESRKIPLLVIIMPDQDQIDNIVSNRSISYMEDFFKENNIQYINIYDYFKNYDSEEFYFKIDGHINEKGHERVAQVIYEKLKNNKVL